MKLDNLFGVSWRCIVKTLIKSIRDLPALRRVPAVVIPCSLTLGISPLASAQDAAERSGTARMETVEVFANRVVNDTSIGRNLLDVREMGRSIQIIDNSLIETVKPVAIEDILAFSSNISYLGDNDGRENSFVMRGFQSVPVLRDGFRVETFGGISDPELYNINRIEVLKGPDSILYGEANPGGLINMRMKRPLAEDHYEFSLDIGDNPSISPRFDLGGGLGSGTGLRYRLIGLYQHNDGWRDYDNGNERFFIAPSLSWAITDRTLLTVLAEFTEDDFPADFGTAIDADGNLTAPRGQVNNHPQDTIERHARTVGADLAHQFSSQWQAEVRVRYFETGYDYSALFLPFGLDLASFQYLRVPAQQAQDNEEIAAQFNMNGDFMVGGMRNRTSAGVDYRASTVENATRFNPGSAAFLEWRNPDYSEAPPPAADIPLAPGFYSNEDITRVGVFLQNHLNLTEQLMLSAGVRYDDVERDPLQGSSTSSQGYDNTSFQAGLRYDVMETTSLFANYSESFSPNFALDKNSQVLPPETGAGYEVGLKGYLFDERLGYTLAWFDIEKSNVAVTDQSAQPTDPNPLGQIAQGKQTSEGFEVDLTGELTEAWSVLASVGYTDTEDETGISIVGAADVTASLWTSYRTNIGLRIGGGFEYVGERLVTGDLDADGNTPDSVWLDSHLLLNAFVGYARGRWHYQVNVSNLTDKKYVDAAWGGLSRSVHAGADRQVLLSIKYQFD